MKTYRVFIRHKGVNFMMEVMALTNYLAEETVAHLLSLDPFQAFGSIKKIEEV